MLRRTFLALGPAAGLVTPAALVTPVAFVTQPSGGIAAGRAAFLALPGNKSFAIVVGAPGSTVWRAGYRPNARLFVGSAFKTFVLAAYLRQVEAGALSEDELLPIDDGIRSLSSPVFGSHPEPSKNLTGATTARSVLEAMITHSDNTGTDAAMLRVGVGRIRALIASAGLTQTMIPDSTRIAFSYLGGAPAGVDEGWAGMEKIMAGGFFGKPRSAINDRETMVSTAAELVFWYRRALRGAFFSQPKTLTEFKRIQAMASVLPHSVPADIAAYAKGGSIDWQEFHALCTAGQMIVGSTPVTFSFTVNWGGPDEGVPKVKEDTTSAVAAMLAAVAKQVG